MILDSFCDEPRKEFTVYSKCSARRQGCRFGTFDQHRAEKPHLAFEQTGSTVGQI
jgi:hypothetical protein